MTRRLQTPRLTHSSSRPGHNGDSLGCPRQRLRLDVPALKRDVCSELTGDRASNKATVRGLTVLNQTDDKSRTLNQHNLLLFAGEAGDSVQFAEFVQANVQLYGMRNETELNSDAVAAFTRREMADNLRSRVTTLHQSPLYRRLLIAGGSQVTETDAVRTHTKY